MSRKKFSDSEIMEIVQRAMAAFGCKRKKDFAKLFGILPQDMTGRMHRGTIVNLIEKEAYKRNVNFDYLLTGKNFPAPADHTYTPADNLVHLVNETKIADKTERYIEKVRFVLNSGTRHAGSLMENIDSFYEAVQDKCDKKSMQGQIDELRAELKEIKDRLPKTGE